MCYSNKSSINHRMCKEEALDQSSIHHQAKKIIPRDMCFTKKSQRVREKEKQPNSKKMQKNISTCKKKQTLLNEPIGNLRDLTKVWASFKNVQNGEELLDFDSLHETNTLENIDDY